MPEIDIVIPLGKGSKHNNLELRYCLRGIERHLKNYGNIYLVGEKPDFVTNVVHVPCPDVYPVPDYNIANKISAAFYNQPNITDDVLFFNDDHYLLSDFDAPTFPYFYEKTCEDYVKTKGDSGYGRRVKQTLKHLKAKNLPTKYFDVHTPILYKKWPYVYHVITHINWKDNKGITLKSLYANSLNIKGTEYQDQKLNIAPTEPVKILSSFSFMSQSMIRFLEKTFPEKSKFEI